MQMLASPSLLINALTSKIEKILESSVFSQGFFVVLSIDDQPSALSVRMLRVMIQVVPHFLFLSGSRGLKVNNSTTLAMKLL